LGFKVFINPDEEIGSPSSKSIIEKLSKGCQIGFIFEPALEDGSVVIQRKGSSNYTLFFKGKSAHAGRNILEGRSAIKALTYLIEELHKEIIPLKTLSLNVGYIKGGEQTNVVPEKALAKLNIRSENNEEMKLFDEVLHNLSKKISLESDVLIHIHKDSSKPPKKNDLATQSLFEILKNTAHELGITLEGKSSGGVCDGNDLSSFGITNIDTMGAVGGSLHTKDEYLNISSLKERTKLIALLLMKIANKEIDL
jgi:glutamate carboxypeptidase